MCPDPLPKGNSLAQALLVVAGQTDVEQAAAVRGFHRTRAARVTRPASVAGDVFLQVLEEHAAITAARTKAAQLPKGIFVAQEMVESHNADMSSGDIMSVFARSMNVGKYRWSWLPSRTARNSCRCERAIMGSSLI